MYFRGCHCRYGLRPGYSNIKPAASAGDRSEVTSHSLSYSDGDPSLSPAAALCPAPLSAGSYHDLNGPRPSQVPGHRLTVSLTVRLELEPASGRPASGLRHGAATVSATVIVTVARVRS